LQNQIIAKANLPNYNLTVTDPGHTHTYSNPLNGGASSQTGGGNGGNSQTGSSTTGITVNTGGSGTALSVLPPAIMFNKIIYAGQ
jgi:hypothetical protein